MGKNFDRTGGFGPFFVSADELPAGAAGLKISTRVNGETRQSDNTANMIFGVGETLSYISRGITLGPGDVIAMGTPAGVADVIAMGTPAGVAHAHTPPKWLRAGDTVEVENRGDWHASESCRRRGDTVRTEASARYEGSCVNQSKNKGPNG